MYFRKLESSWRIKCNKSKRYSAQFSFQPKINDKYKRKSDLFKKETTQSNRLCK